MAVLAYFGHVQPSEFQELDFVVAVELARRVVEMRRDEVERDMKFQAELTKMIMKSNGAKF